jgi:hypothetical protein
MYCLPSADGVEHNSFLYKMRLCATPKWRYNKNVYRTWEQTYIK